MEFFTHDQVIKTLKFLHPQIEHGTDYRCLISIADSPKFIPLSDAWIEAWTVEDVLEPSIEELKTAWVERNLVSWAAPNQPTIEGAQSL